MVLQDVISSLNRIEESLAFLSTLSPTINDSDYRNTQAEQMSHILDWILQHCTDSDCLRRATTLRQSNSRLLLLWQDNFVLGSCTEACHAIRGAGMVNAPTGVGRPRVVLNMDQVDLLRSAGFTWREVENAMLISRSTIWRRLRETGTFMSKYCDIADSALDSIVRDFRHNHPHAGQVVIQGYLTSTGVCVQRYRIRKSISRVDPLGSFLHCRQPVTRRKYAVPGPNSLWHIDGHHSLIRWGLVVHGGIDGFSRLVVYLYCSSNNRADTVTQLFRQATELFGVPSRVRSDKGGENIGVCEFMIRNRGINRGSHTQSEGGTTGTTVARCV